MSGKVGGTKAWQPLHSGVAELYYISSFFFVSFYIIWKDKQFTIVMGEPYDTYSSCLTYHIQSCT